MASFYYYYQNPSGFCFLVEIIAFVILPSLGLITKFKYERKNEMNSGLSSKKTLSCKWPSLFILSKRDDNLIVMQNVQHELHQVSRHYYLL